MKQKILFFSFLALAMSCSENEICDVPSGEFPQEQSSFTMAHKFKSHKFSREKATDIAASFMCKDVSSCNLGFIERNSLSKRGGDSIGIDTLFYVTEFDNGGGFAIVSGDSRFPQEILAYSESGSFDLQKNPDLVFFIDLLGDYYNQHINSIEVDSSFIDEYSPVSSEVSLSKQKMDLDYSENDIVKSVIISSKYKYDCNIGPLVPLIWWQGDPYNIELEDDKALGCTSLATSQLMAYWKHPKSIDDELMDWDRITKYSAIGSFDKKTDYEAIRQIQYLCNKISHECKTHYMKKQSWALPNHSLDVLKKYHYNAPSDYINYTKERVISSINHKIPILAFGTRGLARFGSTAVSVISLGTVHATIPYHVWLIDGYLKRSYEVKRLVTYKSQYSGYNRRQRSDSEYETREETTVTTSEFIHMNWGWGDSLTVCWYHPDVFDCSESYYINGDVIKPEHLEHKDKYSRIHIATDITPKY